MLSNLLGRMPTVLAYLLCFVVLASLSAAISGQPLDGRQSRVAYNALSLLKVPRSPTLHPSGYRAITRGNLLRIGGVLSQVDSLVDGDGDRVAVNVSLESTDNYPGYINVRLGASPAPYRYSIEYADLVATALFVDSGGTSLYTLWDRGDDRLPANFLQDAGFLEHRIEGLLALEFQGTRYADAVYFLDTCQACVEESDPELDAVVAQINTGTSGERYSDLAGDIESLEATYINADVDIPFRVRREVGRLFVDGGVARLAPGVAGDRIFITEAQRLVRPERLLDTVRASISEVDSDVFSTAFELVADDNVSEQEMENTLEGLQALASLSRRTLLQEALLHEKITDVRFLFETLALLRSAREASPGSWGRFRRDLASAALVGNDPRPWDRYVEAFCELYETDDRCREAG